MILAANSYFIQKAGKQEEKYKSRQEIDVDTSELLDRNKKKLQYHLN